MRGVPSLNLFHPVLVMDAGVWEGGGTQDVGSVLHDIHHTWRRTKSLEKGHLNKFEIFSLSKSLLLFSNI